MPRPPDVYTHSQFEPIESDNRGETVRCIHCHQWTGSVKTLNRKKEHLLKCTQYATWRAQGNGQELQPPNSYTPKRASDGIEGAYDQEYVCARQVPPKLFDLASSASRSLRLTLQPLRITVRALRYSCAAIHAHNGTWQESW